MADDRQKMRKVSTLEDKLASMRLSPAHRAILGVCLLGGVVTAGLVLSPSAAIAFVASMADDPIRFAPVVLGLYLLRPLFAWPTTPLAIVVGYGYGIWLGVPIALLGVVCTVIPVYFVARWTTGGDGREAADTDSTATSPTTGTFRTAIERAGSVVERYYETAGPIRGVTASRLAPIPSDVTTVAAAVSGVRLRHLLVGTAIGELPWTVAAVVLGASAATATTAGVAEIGPTLAIACGVAALVLLAGPLYRLAQTRLASA